MSDHKPNNRKKPWRKSIHHQSSSSSDNVNSESSKRKNITGLFSNRSDKRHKTSPSTVDDGSEPITALPGSGLSPAVSSVVPDTLIQPRPPSTTSIIPQISPTITNTISEPTNNVPNTPYTLLQRCFHLNVFNTNDVPRTRTMPSFNDSDLWQLSVQIAQAQLSKHGLPPLVLDNSSLQSQSAIENINYILEKLNCALKEDKNKRWRYTRDGKEVVIVERWGKVLRSINKYSQIIDTAVQHSPQVTALIWASMKMILQVCAIR